MSATDTTEPTTATAAPELQTAQLGIEGMHCASCVARVERELQSVPGVQRATVNLAAEEARVSFAPAALDVSALEEAVERAGYKAHAKAAEVTEDEFAGQDRDRVREHRELMRKFWFSAAVAVPVLALSNATDDIWVWRGLALLTLPVLVWAASQFYTGAWQALKHRSANMHTLIASGISAAYVYSLVAVIDPGIFPEEKYAEVYFDVVAVVTALVVLGMALELKAKGRSSEAIRKLVGLQAKTARVVRDGVERRRPGGGGRGRGSPGSPARREDPGRRRDRRRRVEHRRVDGHGRVAARRQDRRRRGDRRDDQRDRRLPFPRHQGRQGHRAGQHRADGRRRAGDQAADPATRRPGRRRVRPGGDDRRDRCVRGLVRRSARRRRSPTP